MYRTTRDVIFFLQKCCILGLKCRIFFSDYCELIRATDIAFGMHLIKK